MIVIHGLFGLHIAPDSFSLTWMGLGVIGLCLIIWRSDGSALFVDLGILPSSC